MVALASSVLASHKTICPRKSPVAIVLPSGLTARLTSVLAVETNFLTRLASISAREQAVPCLERRLNLIRRNA